MSVELVEHGPDHRLGWIPRSDRRAGQHPLRAADDEHDHGDPDQVGADVSQVAKAMGLDRRIGGKFLHAGLGFGGSCLPKDTNAIVHIGRERDYAMRIVQSAIDVNADLPAVALAKAI